jgi:endonuclease-8
MPEGHTIHRIARDHAKLLVGRQVEVSSPQGRFSADAAAIDGQVLERLEAYGKHLWYWWANGAVGHVHLGLFGKFRVHRRDDPADAVPAPVGEVRMRLESDVAVIDLAGPTACSIGTDDERDEIVRRLGPDPLRRDARPALASERIARSKQAIGALLLDQSVLCGVGNVYRAEALFVNGIHPSRRGVDTSQEERDALWTTVVGMLRQGVKDNRIVTVDRRELDLPRGRRLRRGEATYVYHRDRCLRCGTATATVELAGRPCWYCPTCQPL